MAREHIPRSKRYLNGLLFFCTIWIGIGVVYTSSHPQDFQDLSISLYGADAPLMDSFILEFFTSWPVTLILGSLLIAIIFKRLYVKKFRHIVKINLAGLGVFLLLAFLCVYLLVLPIIGM